MRVLPLAYRLKYGYRRSRSLPLAHRLQYFCKIMESKWFFQRGHRGLPGAALRREDHGPGEVRELALPLRVHAHLGRCALEARA